MRPGILGYLKGICRLCDCARWEPSDDIFCRNCEHEKEDHT